MKLHMEQLRKTVKMGMLRKANYPNTALCPLEIALDTTSLKALFLNSRKWLIWPHPLGFDRYLSHPLPLSVGKHEWVFRSEGQKGNVLPRGKVEAF